MSLSRSAERRNECRIHYQCTRSSVRRSVPIGLSGTTDGTIRVRLFVSVRGKVGIKTMVLFGSAACTSIHRRLILAEVERR